MIHVRVKRWEWKGKGEGGILEILKEEPLQEKKHYKL